MTWRSLRENIEAITVAILLALIIRHFVFESYEIPTGSMAPGLNGLHVTVSCPNCNEDNRVGIHSDSLTNIVNLGNRMEIFEGTCPNTEKNIKITTQGNNLHAKVSGALVDDLQRRSISGGDTRRSRSQDPRFLPGDGGRGPAEQPRMVQGDHGDDRDGR